MTESPDSGDEALVDPALSMLRIYFTFSDALRWSFQGPIVAQYVKVLDEPPKDLTIRDFLEGKFLKESDSIEQDINDLTYVSYWFAALYVVIEGWQELGLHDREIDKLLESPHVQILRRFRNGMFHYQRSYQDARFQQWLFEKTEEAGDWAHDLRNAFARWFKEKRVAVNFNL
jgi:hypothetical protein